MELAELLEQEGLDPETLMPWARARADALVAELSDSGIEAEGPLRALLDGLAVADAELEVASRISNAASFTPLTEPSGLQPLAGAADLPPPPEPLVHVHGEPDTLLETFDTSTFEIASPNAETVITEIPVAPEAETVTEPRPVSTIETAISPSPYFGDDGEVSEQVEDDDEELEELELDELVELDEDELVELDEDDDEDEQSEAGPPPPPPSSDAADPGLAVAELEPVRSGDTATGLPVVGEPIATEHDSDLEHAPIRSGDTATGLPVVSEPIATEHELALADAPVRSGDTATGLPIVREDDEPEPPVQTGETASFPTLADAEAVRTGATAAHVALAEDVAEEVDLDDASGPASAAYDSDDDESFELDFDD